MVGLKRAGAKMIITYHALDVAKWLKEEGKIKMIDTRSKELYERAKVHIPGGVNSPVRAFRAVNRTPRFMEFAKGDRIIDADGNEYIDYVCSWGPGILGHAHPSSHQKVMDSCGKRFDFRSTNREGSDPLQN